MTRVENMTSLQAFRQETRDWLQANCPPAMREPVREEQDLCWGGRRATFANDEQRVWLQRMAERGWTVPTWPVEYGGAGLDAQQAGVLAEEMRALGCRSPLKSFGISMLGPALLKFGTHEQKAEHLPPIARGEIRWCQGYSEPNAGSDLASLQTRAQDQGDHFIVNGQKIWTSYADRADWIFCLVRTDPAARKHTGISFVLFDMQTPGVSTRPITLISGRSPFCETFFDDVRVDKRHLVGTLNDGWTVAKYLLTHERDMIGEMGNRGHRTPRDVALATVGRDAQDRLDDGVLRAEIAAFDADEAAFAALMRRTRDEAATGGVHPAFSSVLKYYGSELNKRRHELLMSAGGSQALAWEGEASQDGAAARAWLRTKANSIEGGTSEVQLNIIAKRILALPGA